MYAISCSHPQHPKPGVPHVLLLFSKQGTEDPNPILTSGLIWNKALRKAGFHWSAQLSFLHSGLEVDTKTDHGLWLQ
jgi:hypothetical protein